MLIPVKSKPLSGNRKNSYKKNTELNEELPYYTIDEEDHSKISYGNEIYMITGNCFISNGFPGKLLFEKRKNSNY